LIGISRKREERNAKKLSRQRQQYPLMFIFKNLACKYSEVSLEIAKENCKK
jgi:hypothetical protein